MSIVSHLHQLFRFCQLVEADMVEFIPIKSCIVKA